MDSLATFITSLAGISSSGFPVKPWADKSATRSNNGAAEALMTEPLIGPFLWTEGTLYPGNWTHPCPSLAP